MGMIIDRRNFRKAKDYLRGTVTAIEKAEYRAVNRVSQKTRTEASRQIRAEVRLKASYVNRHLWLYKKAKPGDPSAIITARRRPTRLARYGAKQLTKAARKARGDELRGISAGRKQAGVSVSVGRNSGRKRMRKTFLVPLRTNGLMGVFERTGRAPDDIRHLYGPSVDQLFTNIRDQLHPFIKRNMSKEFRAQLNYAMGRR